MEKSSDRLQCEFGFSGRFVLKCLYHYESGAFGGLILRVDVVVRFDTNRQIKHLGQDEWISEILSSGWMCMYSGSIVVNRKIVRDCRQPTNHITTETEHMTTLTVSCRRMV